VFGGLHVRIPSLLCNPAFDISKQRFLHVAAEYFRFPGLQQQSPDLNLKILYIPFRPISASRSA